MGIYLLDERISFPPPHLADDGTGILAVGGDLSPERLLLAYSMGIFPWYDDASSPILWHAPPFRMLLAPDEIYVGRTLRKQLRKTRLEMRYDTAFEAVLDACAKIPRADQQGTWLNDDMREAYLRLHALGRAHSAEAWLDGELVGGLYGVTVGGAFFGESMFSGVSGASKVVFIRLAAELQRCGYSLIDCQVYTDHLAAMGAYEVPRDDFQKRLEGAIKRWPNPSWPSWPG